MSQSRTRSARRNLQITSPRLWASLMEMARIGGTPKGGCKRLTLTELDRQGRDLFINWCRQAGCSIKIDRMGNIFARRAGTDDSLPPVMMGSHLDTQPTGGKYDGILGVLGGLEVLRTLQDHGIKTKHPIELVNWTNEEGSRFAPAMLASGVYAGVYTEEFAYSRQDSEGQKLGDALVAIGYQGKDEMSGRKIHAAFELHIEQGPILEDENYDIGVVTHGQGIRWYEINLTGFESHAGSTPMPTRHDALLGAARVIEAVNSIALNHAPLAVGTVGMVNNYPNSRNVIPGSVFITVDFRHPTDDVMTAMEQELKAAVVKIDRDLGITSEIKSVFYFPPVAFDPNCVDAVRRAASDLGFKHRDIVSGAGHDACYLARVAPTAMIFTPCVDGISHNEAEEISEEWAAAGCAVLLHAVLESAELRES
ncbi:MAG: Zn-dependent hydrolase [Candidatus Pacebacteria bacterium]|nr:Zn-dependent hydrolase [Candidatus Paceibacterota bacterium]